MQDFCTLLQDQELVFGIILEKKTFHKRNKWN